MNKKSDQHSGLKRWLRRIGWVMAGLVAVAILFRLSLKTNFIQNRAKNFLVSTANQQLNGKLTIDRLSGDLWKEVTISGISLTQQDTLAQVDSVHAEYNVWAFWGGRVEVSDLGIYRPHLMARQQNDQWNFQNIVASESADTSSGGTIPLKIDNLILTDGNIAVQSDSLLAESNFVVDGLEISSSLAYAKNSFDFNLRDLSFQLGNERLEQPLRVQTAASARQDNITLEKLVLATGNSMIQSSGVANPIDSTIQFNFSATPVAWKDIASYARDFPLRENVQIDLSLKGKPDQFELELTADAEGLQSFSVNSRFQWHSGLTLQDLSVQADYIDARTLLSDTTMPSLQDFRAQFAGQIDMSDYRKGRGNLKISADRITLNPYHLDSLVGNGTLEGQQATLKLKAQQQSQQLTSTLEVNRLWSDLPSVKGNLKAANIDPAYWMQDTTYAGRISFRSDFEGNGWYPQKEPWKYSLSINESRFMEQSIKQLSARGKVSSRDVSIDARLQTRDGKINLAANLQDLTGDPKYDYNVETQDVDLGAVTGRDDFTTALNSKVTGQGQGFTPETLQLRTSISVDSSLVNGELVRNLSADLLVRDTVAVVDSALIKSSIAEGSFNLQLNMLRRYDPGNKLSFDLELKDLSALAPLADVENLQAEGLVEGNLSPIKNEDLRFVGTIDLSNLRYNALFTAARAQGSIDLRTQQSLTYQADLDLTSPTFSGVQLQDLGFKTQGLYADSTANGSYEIRFSSPNEGRIEQRGTYALHQDSAKVRTNEFNIVSDYRTLSLENPFELLVKDDLLRMDTMRVSSSDGAFLEIGIPIATADEQRGFIRGQALNTAVIQSCLLGKNYFKGYLSGQFEIARRDTNLNASGALLVSDVSYENTNVDSLILEGQIEKERLDGTLSVQDGGKQLVMGELHLPFKLGDPEKLPSSFFEEPVDGSIRVSDFAIERFQSLLEKTGITQTSGIFSLRGVLEGTAGDPDFSADASLKNANLSGVAVDSVTAGMDYRHEDAELHLDASVLSLRQKAAEINAQFPLFINMRSFRVDLPQKKDSIAVDISTSNFNLKAVNDFLDRRPVREVTGQLNGEVKMTGAMGDLKTDGNLELRNGAFRLVPAGIRVTNMQSSLDFDPDKIRLKNFSAKSGNGTLRANGILELEKLIPGDIDFSVTATNFRAANTSQYNAVINMDARAGGQVTKPEITGQLNFVSGFLKLQNFGEKSVESVKLDSAQAAEPTVSIYDSLALDMDVVFNRRFYIRNQRYLEMEVELDGQLDLFKDPGKDLQLFGEMNAPNGYARPFGKEFGLEEGAVTFSGDPGNPQLMIRSRYEPPQTQEDVVIWYVIEGTVEKPKFKYESQPPMELENIISYTLFGQPFYALNSWKQVVASSGGNTTAADVALDVLLDRVEALATQRLGIDVVRIGNSRVSGETGTSITTGWYLNPKVFFAIQNVITGSTPDTGFLLEYMLRKDLKLILQQGSDFRQGVDIKWNYDY